MSGRSHGKERQMDYEHVNTSFWRYFGACYVYHRTGISLMNAQKTVEVIVKALAQISVIRAGIR